MSGCSPTRPGEPKQGHPWVLEWGNREAQRGRKQE
jgi:hypothetical protein